MDTKDPHPAIALIGDSHAAAIAPALRLLAREKGYKVYELTKHSCAPLVGVAHYVTTLAAEQECVAYNAGVLSLLEKDSQVQIVVMTAFWSEPERNNRAFEKPTGKSVPKEQVRAENYTNLTQGLEGTINSLQLSGKQVILVKDVPVFSFDPVHRIWSQYIPTRRVLVNAFFPTTDTEGTASLSEAFPVQAAHAEAIITQVAQHQKVPVFDPKNNLCSNDQCIYVQGLTPLYFDIQHLTIAGAQKALVGFPL